jgi:hypothetical protein
MDINTPPWVARHKSGAGVDWATSFWQLAALLSMNADDARRILRGRDDDLEAAAAALSNDPRRPGSLHREPGRSIARRGATPC